jgi:thioredoxin-like negative regulator of GroEL
MGLPIITKYDNRAKFLESLNNNPGLIIIKFGAEWCGPCKIIEEDVHKVFTGMPNTVQCAIIDVDENFDLYAFMKSKKIVQGIPTLLCYFKGNTHYAPDEIMIGTDKTELHNFFIRCMTEIN